MHTRPVLVTLINIYFTVLSFISVVTLAEIAPNFIGTRAVVAGIALAFVNVSFAVSTGHAQHTETHVSVGVRQIERSVEEAWDGDIQL